MTRRTKLAIIAGAVLAAAVGVLLFPRLPQNSTYHNFADQRTLLGIPRCLDVISNAPFLVVGALGVVFVARQRGADLRPQFIETQERWPYLVFFLGVGLTSFGSSYYHLAPDNARLVWDRLPMTIGFSALVAATVIERISVKAGLRMLLPLVVIGVGSVVYWRLSELEGKGDLRPYAIVQFGSLLTVLLMAVLLPSRYTRGGDMLIVLGMYVLAKLLELLDAAIFGLGRVVSGHTLKHLTAAGATYGVLRMLRLRSLETESV